MKRRYPFEESSCHQLKYHIGEKELNGGVKTDDKMQAVYDKTLSLLFRGANKSKSIDVDPEPPKSLVQFVSKISFTPKPRQMLLQWTPSGQLHLNGQNNNWSEPSTSWMPSPTLPTCFSCQNVKFEEKKKCDFCENSVCAACRRFCHQCQKEFCQLCAIPTYNYQEEMAVCLSCMS